MNSEHMLRKLAAHNPVRYAGQKGFEMTRRRLLAHLGAAGALALAGAGSRAMAQDDRTLNLLCWDAYADPRLAELWRKDTGTKLRSEIHISDPTSVNRLRAGETTVWDFVNLNNPWARDVLLARGADHRPAARPLRAALRSDVAEVRAALRVGDERGRPASPGRRAALRDLRLRGQLGHDLDPRRPRTRAGTCSTTPTSPTFGDPRLRGLERHGHLHGRRRPSLQGQDRRRRRQLRRDGEPLDRSRRS